LKKILFLFLISIILSIFSPVVFSSETIHVKDYIQDKLPSIFQFYLSSLEELNQDEKEFIDLLVKLPKKEQENYAKKVYNNGFSLELLNNIKELEKVKEPKIVYGSDTSSTIIGPVDTVLEKAQEIDYGHILIPEDIFPEGRGLPIPIFVPRVENNSNISFDDWSIIKKISDDKVNFSQEKLLKNLVTFTVEYPGKDLILGFTKSFAEAFDKNAFMITIQRSSQGEFRAIIQIATDEMNIIRAKAGDVINSPSSSVPAIAWSRYLQERFSLPSINGLYRSAWNIDKNHKEDPYVSYLSLYTKKNAVLITPKVYSGDNFKIMKEVFIVGPIVLDLKGKDYINAWSYLLPIEEPETLNILNLLPISLPEEEFNAIPYTEEEKKLAVALVMDRSGSMSGEKLAKEMNAADAFVAGLHNDEYSCLVTFSASARTEVELLQVTPANKRKFHAAVETVGAGGNTNIGAGLTHGLQQLTRAGESTPRAALLMSDGKHNTGELWPVVEEYELRGWPIHTVAYGSDADQENLENIAMRTGGTFFPANIFTISQIYQRISAHTHNQSVLFAYNDMISQGKKLDYQIPIEPDITSTTFFVDWQGSVVDLHLQTPEEKKINPDNYKNFPGVDYQTGDTFCFYQVDEPKSGDWQATLYGKEIDRESEQVNLTVSGSSPLLVNIFGLQPSYRRGEAIQIKVKVLGLFGSEPEILRDIKVTAKIKKPSPNLKKMLQKRVIDLGKLFQYALTGKRTISLHDDGSHGDWRADDGIFGAFYKDTDENGHYVITIKCAAQKPDGEKITRTLQESVQVGPIEDRTVTLADFLGL
jgi:uncharacterized protein YegL